ncbi:MAG: EamA family transporter, partial [Candidatus Puniceispirillaceae bacterium]
MTSQPNRFLTESVKDQLAWAFVVICPLFFSSNMLIARGMSGIFPPISMAFSRWFFVGILVIGSLIILRRFEWRTVLREYRQILFLASLGMGLCGGPVYLAGELTTATNIGLIYSAAPLLIALLAFVGFRETLTKRQGLGLTLGLIGVVMILSQAEMARLFDLRFNTGDLWIVLATISFSVYSLGLKY